MGKSGLIAVFWDYENARVWAQGIKLPLAESIINLTNELGTAIIMNVYSKWRKENVKIAESLYSLGFDQINVPITKDNSADIMLSGDIITTLYEHPDITTYIIITGDKDFISIVNKLKRKGKKVIIIGPADTSSEHLQISASEFISFNELGKVKEEPSEEEELITFENAVECLISAIKKTIEDGKATQLSPINIAMKADSTHNYNGPKSIIHPDTDGTTVLKFRSFKPFVEYVESIGKIQISSVGDFTEVFLPSEDPKEESAFAADYEKLISNLDKDDWNLLFDQVEASTDPNKVEEEYMGRRMNIHFHLKQARDHVKVQITNRTISRIIDLLSEEGLLVQIENMYFLHADYDILKELFIEKFAHR